MNVMKKLTLRSLSLNKKRTAATVIGIILSVALMTAVASVYMSGVQSLINFEIREKGNYHVAFYGCDPGMSDEFENNRKIEYAAVTQTIGYAEIGSKNEYKPYACVCGFTKTALGELGINLVEGRLPENDGEIVIPTHLRSNGRVVLNIGDTVTLNVGRRVDGEGNELGHFDPYISPLFASPGEDENGEDTASAAGESIADAVEKTYKIVGVIERPDSAVEDYASPGYTFATLIDGDDLSGSVDIFLRFKKKDVKDVYKVTAAVLGVDPVLFEKACTDVSKLTDGELDELEKQGRDITYIYTTNDYLIQLETNPLAVTGIDSIGTVAAIVILIIAVSSVFCIKNSFDISISEKIRQYGMLRSIGATKKQIRRNVFFEAAVLGAVGIPLGILLGTGASYALMKISGYYLKDMFVYGASNSLVFAFSWIAIGIAAGVGCVTIYFSALSSAVKASRVSPIDSVRNSADIKLKAKKMRCPKYIGRLFGVGGEISYKNLKRSRKKYRTTVISIVVSVAVFIALASFMGMAFDSAEKDIGIWEYNLSLSSHNINNGNIRKYLRTTELDTIEEYCVVRGTGVMTDRVEYSDDYAEWTGADKDTGDYIQIITVDREQYDKYLKACGIGYDDVRDKGVLVDYASYGRYEERKYVEKNMREFAYEKGDVISGEADDGSTLAITVGAVAKERPFGLKNSGNAYIILSEEYFDSVAQTKNLSIYFNSTDTDSLHDEIDKILADEEYNVDDVNEDFRLMNNLFTLIGIFLYGFIIVITLIGVTNIFNTITTNVELRRREFATLRSVGMTKREFNKMIRLESLFMGLRALLFGLPIGILLSYLIYNSLVGPENAPYTFPTAAVLLSVVAIFALLFVLMKYSVGKINRQNTIETIRNENI